jgi:hypothetical protein
MEAKICDLCGRRINPMKHGETYYGCKIKKPRVYKWFKSLKLYTWSDIDICNECATIIANMAQKKDPLK